ncbi:hypothetical protein Snov_2942 [Ancylobacter novellus DSM 506]|uniref:Uncharacterized protein n=1 Tax=Ancylobacter novellus (strain ATCC 8093 / DSM 506 / JCM 20403 / CCM 1077 / IAM 12100 / NBRC 12443 / NCIMB 10456) TaxID=639283 RepID=D7A6M3_ANCN5|nr:hypothetical protein [Ancylobacter novellus]ADH90221.1 hypothetical protein Snov_2942 [Ancylobacter novellus DSM 506]
MPPSDLVQKLRDASVIPPDVRNEDELRELLREAAETIETLMRQQKEGELFLDFSSRSPRKGGGC